MLGTTRHALAAASLLLALTGCGSDPGDAADGDAAPASSPPASAPASTGLPKAEYLAQSEALCAQANEELDVLDAQEPASFEAILEQFRAGTDIARRTTEQLAALAAEQPDRVDLEGGLIRPLQAQVKAFEDYDAVLAQAVAQGPEAFDTLPELSPPPPAPLEALRAYGFDACVEAADTE
jgi:hypothetical protein